jgi:hypothetical protein
LADRFEAFDLSNVVKETDAKVSTIDAYLSDVDIKSPPLASVEFEPEFGCLIITNCVNESLVKCKISKELGQTAANRANSTGECLDRLIIACRNAEVLIYNDHSFAGRFDQSIKHNS